MDDIISIVVPIYNVEKYLKRCVDSLKNQTYTNIEIILVDDGSPDNCPLLCDQYAASDSRIKVIHKKNGGLSDARNVGIKVAIGKYILFVDSDDYIESDMVRTMYEAIRRTGAEIACCGRYYVDQKIVEQHILEKEKIYSPKEAILEILSHGCIEEAAWDKMYLKSLFNTIEYPVGEINEDAVTTPWLIHKANKIVHVGKPLYYYCQNQGSITRSGYKKAQNVYIKHITQVKIFVEQFYPDLLKDFYTLQARYATNSLFLIVESKESKKIFIEDYKIYKTLLRQSIFYMLLNKNLPEDYKIKSLLLSLGVFGIVRDMTKRLKNDRSNNKK